LWLEAGCFPSSLDLLGTCFGRSFPFVANRHFLFLKNFFSFFRKTDVFFRLRPSLFPGSSFYARSERVFRKIDVTFISEPSLHREFFAGFVLLTRNGPRSFFSRSNVQGDMAFTDEDPFSLRGPVLSFFFGRAACPTRGVQFFFLSAWRPFFLGLGATVPCRGFAEVNRLLFFSFFFRFPPHS